MTKRALVTGGAGFIGSHVADIYLANGYDVTVIDNFASGKRENIPTAATFHEMDIASPDAAALIRDGRFDVISHLAAQIDVRKSVSDPAYDAAVNIGGSLNLLEAVRQSGYATRFVFSSTGGAIYGEFVTPPNVEEYPKDPESPYGIAKCSVELYMAYYGRVHGVESVALRYANVYGPRQNPHGEAGVVAIFCERILNGQPLTLFGEGKLTRDYVYVGDVARANLAAARATLEPVGRLDVRAFNIGTGIETSVERLATILKAAGGADAANVALNLAPARPGEQHRSAVSIEKAARGLPWAPEMPLERGLGQTFEFFAARHRAATA